MSYPGKFISTSAGRVFVHRGGVAGAPSLVLLHGFMMSHYYFRSVLERLEKSYDVTAIDLPGHGESDNPSVDRFTYDFSSMAATVIEVLDDLGLKRPAILGHSFGGGTALELAVRFPDRVERLILACPTVYAIPKPIEAQVALAPVVGEFVWHNLFSSREMKRGMRRQHVRDPKVVTDEFIDYYWERFSRAYGKRAAYATMQAIFRLSDQNADPTRVKVPTLLIWGDEDQVVPLHHGRRLQREIPGAELAIIANSGHLIHMERPDEWLAAVNAFMAPNKSVSASCSQARA